MLFASFDPLLRAALWASGAALMLAMALGAAILLLRIRLRMSERRWQAFLSRWRPVLLAIVIDPYAAGPLPQLKAAEHPLFLRLWTYLHESVRGVAAARLNAVAKLLEVDRSARHLLTTGTRAERLQATLALAYLRDWKARARLVRQVSNHDSLLSVHAARALVRIDPFAAGHLVRLLVQRDDWDLTWMARVVGEAPRPFWIALSRALPRMGAQELRRALAAAEAVRLQLSDSLLARLLQPEQAPAVVKAAIRLCNTLALVPELERCLVHADPDIRAGAARQLATLATPPQLPALARLLDDPDWAVRMAAAEALGRIPYVSSDALRDLLAEHPLADPALRQVLAERGGA